MRQKRLQLHKLARLQALRKNHDQQDETLIMREKQSGAGGTRPIAGQGPLFLDDWQKPPKIVDEDDEPHLGEVKKWRLQILLAVNPWGIPSLAFAQAYEKMFSRPLEVRNLGFENLSEMVDKLKDIFAVQEPDEMTALLFPEYARDRILHDARLGHDFSRPQYDNVEYDYDPDGKSKEDVNDLIHQAWLDRDQEFPPDVVLAGEPYDLIFPLVSANIPGTKGLYQGTIVSAATPESFYIRLESNCDDEMNQLSNEIEQYFKGSEYSIDAYSVPNQFIYPGFPCLCYIANEKIWERCMVIGRSKSDKKILVESVDHGGVLAVYQIYLYLVPRSFFTLPRQTIHVSLPGLKPAFETSKWSQRAGARMRCFSIQEYKLDLLLVEPSRKDVEVIDDDESIAESAVSSETNHSIFRVGKIKKKQRPVRRAQYDVLAVDRNEDDIDVFLDEILVLETYADRDSDYDVSYLKNIKQELKNALDKLPRPKNPMNA